MRILIDTNVILDIARKRKPFFADSHQALRKAIEADAECLISVPAITPTEFLKKCLRHFNPLAPIHGGIRGFFLCRFPA